MILFSVPPPIWFLVATRAFTGAMHLLCHTTVSIPVYCIFGLVCVEISFWRREGSWMGGEDTLIYPVRGKVMLVGRVLHGLFYAGGNGLRLLCCSCLFSSGKQLKAVLASCPFWCKQGSAPGSSGSELWCLNRLLGYTPGVTECHWNAVSRISRAHCPVLARGAEDRQRWKRTLLYLVWHVKHWACGNSRLYWYGRLKGSCDSAGAMLFPCLLHMEGEGKERAIGRIAQVTVIPLGWCKHQSQWAHS